MNRGVLILGLSLVPATLVAAEPADRLAASKATAARIDELLHASWSRRQLAPAAAAEPRELARRLTLDLCGRIPMRGEVGPLVSDPAAGIDRLLESPEFSLHFARVIDGWVQYRQSGDEAFVEWLRQALAKRRSWDVLFRTVLTGPWDAPPERGAARFLAKRVKNLDSLTTDATRAFFGVDITCARCHDHPLVDDWKQQHYYGMASFFNRTQETGKDGLVAEKPDGEVQFQPGKGGQQTAAMMFLTGQSFPSAPKQNRREQLVAAALAEKSFLARAAVNRTWAWLFGRGLVDPVDQMHSGNPPSVPGLLEFLAEDFVAHGYDLRHLVRSICLTRAYQASTRPAGTPPAGAFAAQALRPLTPHQYALSLVLATGDPLLLPSDDPVIREHKLREAEKQAAVLLAGLDTTVEGYHASAREALYLANHAAVQGLVVPRGNNLAARLAKLSSHSDRIETAFEELAGRSPTAAEREALRTALETADVQTGVSDIVWALATSAEFRFVP